MPSQSAVYIASTARTPIGSFLGSLSSLSAVELGSLAIKGAIQRAGIKTTDVNELFFGNVLSAWLGQSPAHQAANGAGLPHDVICTTVNKVCASSMKAVIFAAQSIILGTTPVAVAAGAESMSNTPYYLPTLRRGGRYGHQTVIDGVLTDGLTDAASQEHMGIHTERCAAEHQLTREAQDEYAIESYKRAQAATEACLFSEILEVEPINGLHKHGYKIDRDEEVDRLNVEKLKAARPAFTPNGTITAANAAPVNDGAAALVMMSEEKVRELGVKPLFKVVGWADAECQAERFAVAPSVAIPQAIKHAGLTPEEIDFYEINEAFSAVALVNMKRLNLSTEQVNIFGGSVAMGHPLGCSGARIIATLTSVLMYKKAKFGCAAICNGGGGASAVVIENLQEQ